MSTQGGDQISNDQGNIFTNQPYAWILTPLTVFVAIGLLATCFQVRRRRRLRRLGLSPSDPEYQARLAGGSVADTRNRTGRPANARTGRWNWPSRSEEGLNELGEAPPAYEHKPKGQGVGSDESVELAPMGRTQTGGASVVVPATAVTAAATNEPAPPGYLDATGGSTSTGSPPPATSPPPPTVTSPPPAILPSSTHRFA